MLAFPDFTARNQIAISCAPFIAPWLQLGLRSLGYESNKIAETIIFLDGTFEDCIHLNLSLRTGNRVFFLLKKFEAGSMDKIYTEAKDFQWENLLKQDGYFSVHSEGAHEELKNTMFLNVKVKDAIVDRLREITGQRPNSGSDKRQAVIYVHWNEQECSLYLDTSGETLTKHGYRKTPMLAPLQESLAAAMIASSKWNRKAPFINPMCGSGTLAIEAAMMAINKPPGLLRSNFGFMHVLAFEHNRFLLIRNKIESEANKNQVTIIASDINRKAVDIAKENAKNAGVEYMIDFKTCALEDTPVPSGGGIVMINPPYGERIGNTVELEKLYETIGSFFKKKCGGYTGYVFSGNAGLNKFIGLKTSRKIRFLNGSLECRLLEYELYAGTKKQKRQTLSEPM